MTIINFTFLCQVIILNEGMNVALLKNLVHTPINKITAIDLDTIDATNLNRQFLFRYEHVGKSKAEVAGDSVLNMRPVFDSSLLEKNLKC
jgi:ubiquitin-like 1-activating enzyme E1 B